MSFGEEDGEEFDQVKVALVPVVELDVPDEFGVSGHVVVSDHAAVPPATELHPDVSSDEVVRVRGRVRRRRGLGEEITGDPSLPMGRRGLRWWEMGGESLRSLPPWADSWGESTRGHHSPVSVPSYLSPRTLGVGTKVGEVGAGCEERVRWAIVGGGAGST